MIKNKKLNFFKKKLPYQLIHYRSLASTNSFALENIDEFCDRDVVSAETQSSGRGRLNRQWLSTPPGNIYQSIVLKPLLKAFQNSPLTNLTQYAAVSLCRTLKKYKVNAHIKWPNDVLVNGRKIAGILSETAFTGQELKGIVIGTGISLNFTAEIISQIDQPAAALNLILNKDINKEHFQHLFLSYFFKYYTIFIKKGFPYIRQHYIRHCNFLNREITINNAGCILTGKAVNINNDGTLKVIKNNQEHNINIGDISWKD